MVIPNVPTDDLAREMYARFGLAYYFSEVLHRGLCMLLAISDLPRRDLVTRPRVEEHLAHAFSLTFGEVITELTEKVPPEYSRRLVEVREKRNFLAHHFWFERAHLMFKPEHIQGLIQELDGYTETFNQLEEEISECLDKKQRDLGLTPQKIQDCLTKLLSGEVEEPLPGKDLVRDREKRLKRKQHLVRVWEFELPEGGKPLVFEMQDRTLWQLCDVGLGWTRFRNTESHWIEQPDIQPYLPADISPRPKNAKAWEYEFKLKGGVSFWVKPGKHPRTFQWGISKKNRDRH